MSECDFASCLSRSLKVIGTNIDWSAIYDFQWVIHRQSRTISKINGDSVEYRKTFLPRVFNTLDERVPLELCNSSRAKKI